MSNFTQDLKVGDPVVVRFGRSSHSMRIDKVGRITKTQIFLCKSEYEFKRRNGDIVGDDWSAIYLMEATPENIAAAKRSTAEAITNAKLSLLDVSELSDADLNELRQLLVRLEADR